MLLMTLWCMLLLVNGEPPRTHRTPLLYKWPSITRSAHYHQPLRSSNGMLLQLRGSGSTNVFSRAAVPNMFIKSHNPIQFAMPMRLSNRPLTSLKTAPSTHIYFKTGPPKKQHFASTTFTSSPAIIKYSSPGGHKTAIKFKSPPPLKTKPEFIFEKVTVPKFAEPIIANEAAIHQIAAPNLSLNQLDNDLTKTPIQAFGSSLEKPVHYYQVQENSNDLTIKNSVTGEKKYYAPDNDPTLKTPAVKPIYNDPINSPSDLKLKPSDVLYHQNIDFNPSPLVQQHFAIDPFQFPVTAQPQLQQYHLQQNAMTHNGLPLAAYNPTYLVQMSNSLLGQHQQHLPSKIFTPAQGYIDTSSLVQQQPQIASPPIDKNYEVASLGQIISANQDFQNQLNGAITSTLAPSTISDVYNLDFSAAASQNHNVPSSIAHLPDPKPNSYSYSQNFIDLPDEHLTGSNEYQTLLNYDDAYRRQIENDLILKEAHDELKKKFEKQQQQEAVAFDLHQHALAEKFSPLRIIVPDEDYTEVI